MMPALYKNDDSSNGAFTLAEVLVAIGVATLFGLAAFATNERLLIALKAQKESTAASMMLQERMEGFRALAYSDASSSQPGSSPCASPCASPVLTAANIVQIPTVSEAGLGTVNNLAEKVTVSGYLLAPSGTPSTHTNQWMRNSSNPTGNQLDTNTSLATNYDLIKVDIELKWTGTDGRSRTRDLSAVFGKGNIGQ
jgi:hypothetical protein